MNNVSQSLDDILALVASKINVDAKTLSTDTDLFAAGLDSITLMGLIAHWRAAGYPVNFATFAREPKASAWAEFLSASKQQTQVLDKAGENGAELSRTQRTKSDAPFPLAPMQYAYWLGRDPKQPYGGVSAHLYTEFQSASDKNNSGFLDPNRLSNALKRLCERHPSLRLKVTVDGQQTYVPLDQVNPLRVNDWRHETESFVAQQLEHCREIFSSQMLDIEAGEVLAIALSLLPDGSSRLHLDVDMIAADAVSYRTLLRELALLYENVDLNLPVLPATYRDYRLASEKHWPAVKVSAGQWWQDRLYSLPEGPQLPLKRFTGAPQTTRRHFHFDASLRNALYAHSRSHGLTPAAVLATVLAETLAGWSREPRFLLNVPLFLRPMEGADMSGVVGDFSSSIMLDADMSSKQPFAERAKKIQSRLHEDAAHADYNGVQVLRDLGRLKGRQITAPVVFTSALNLGELFDEAVRRVFGDPIWIISQGPQVLLDTQVTELDGGLLLNWDCREDAFMDGVLDAMFDFFQQSILSLANTPLTWTRCLADALPADRILPEASSTLNTLDLQTAASPRTPVEKAVAAVWREVIGGEGNNVHQNLFAAGGDSVLANSLVAQLREIFGVGSINMQRLFAAPTIAGLAEAISATDAERITQVAEIYCEIAELDDEALLAELEGAES
jgi:mycobactin phenyloxazoline synthetase